MFASLIAVKEELIHIFDDIQILQGDLPLAVVPRITDVIGEIQEMINTSEASDVAAIHRKIDASTQSSLTRTTFLTPANTQERSTSPVNHVLSTPDTRAVDNDSVFLKSMDFTPNLIADTSSNERSKETNRPLGDRNAFDYLIALSPITIVQESEPDFSNYTNAGSPDYDYSSPSGDEDIILLSSSEEDNLS